MGWICYINNKYEVIDNLPIKEDAKYRCTFMG